MPLLVHLTHKIALDVSEEQEEYFFRSCGVARAAFNRGLDIWKEKYEPRRLAKEHNEIQQHIKLYLADLGIKYKPKKKKLPKGPTVFDVKKEFNSQKKKDYPWMYEVSKFAAEYGIINLGKAYQNLFRGSGFPKYKSRKNNDFSFCAGNSSSKKPLYLPSYGKNIYIPGLDQNVARRLDVSSPLENGKKHKAKLEDGMVKMREALRFSGRVILVTITLEAGRWYASITVETEIDVNRDNDTQVSVGVDLGAAILAYLSSGEQFEGPKPLRELEMRLAKLQKRFAKTEVHTVELEDGRKIKKDSRLRAKLRLRIQRLHAHIANIRKDYLHKLTTYLVKTFDNIFIEDLNVKGMVKNHHLAKAILDMGFGELKRQLVYKAKLYGSRIFMVDRWFPSSKKCSCCGEKQGKMPLSVRKWTCDSCGTNHDRDGNAANNLNGLLEYVLMADAMNDNNNPVVYSATTGWDENNCTYFGYNDRVYSIKNLTAA